MEDKILDMFNTPRDEDRIDEFLSTLGKLWHRYPDMRFGQLIRNIAIDNFYMEDDVSLKRIKNCLTDIN